MAKQEDLEEKFLSAMADWERHAETTLHFSTNQPMLDCDAYRTIISMGKDALPLLRRAYELGSSNDFALVCVKVHGIVHAVRDILGDDFNIPDEIRGNVRATVDYTKNWLDENMNKYLK